MTTCDAVVVGGGFAGVAAARELQAAGLSTILLEARDRLGGRTWTTDFDGVPVELGGAWVHWRQPHLWAELTRYGIGIEEDSWDFDTVLGGNPPRRHPPDAAFEKMRTLFSRYAAPGEASLPRPYDPLFLSADLAELDRLSMEDRLADMGLSSSERDWLTGLLYEIAGTSLDRAGLLPVLRWMALSDWSIERWYDTNRYRPAGGTVTLIRAMLADEQVEVRLSSPVVAIEANEDGVLVSTRDGETVRGSTVVVAVPVNLWSSIDFRPALPADHAAAARVGMGKPHQDKVWIRVRGEIGRVFAQLPAPAPLGFFWTYRELDDGQLIMGINANPDLDVTDPDRVAETLRGYVPEIAEVQGVLGHCWSADPYSLGGNTCHKPGQVTRHLEALQRPWRRLAFATADIASGWVGYIDGAIESGIRAARQSRDLVGGPLP